MELRDLIVTPLVLIITFFGAYIIRPYVTDPVNRRYFIPALSVKIVGAIALGFIYQFYYSGGDTFNFHTHGSRHIWEAFMDSPAVGLQMMFSNGQHTGKIYAYSSQIPLFSDQSSFFVIRMAAFFDLFTFSTYSATAICFALLSFIGMWMFFLTFYKKYPGLHLEIACAAFFVPSVFFWGSGLMKDTLMMGCLGIITYEVDRILFRRKSSLIHILALLISIYCVFEVKKFILQAFLPSILVWTYLAYVQSIRMLLLRILIFPIIVVFSVPSLYYSVAKIGEGDSRYALENLAQTAKITAYDIRFQTGKDAGSGYTLGILDGTFGSMLALTPQAINVSLFRPYLWEVSNPLMLLAALESLFFLLMTFLLLVRFRLRLFKALRNPDTGFCFMFSLIYAFAVGISSFNFGTLVRYKIPLMPYYALGLILILYENRPRKVEELERVE